MLVLELRDDVRSSDVELPLYGVDIPADAGSDDEDDVDESGGGIDALMLLLPDGGQRMLLEYTALTAMRMQREGALPEERRSDPLWMLRMRFVMGVQPLACVTARQQNSSNSETTERQCSPSDNP